MAAGTGTGWWGVRCTESTPAVTEHSEGCESQRCRNLRWRAAPLGAGVPYKRRTARHLEEAIQSESMWARKWITMQQAIRVHDSGNPDRRERLLAACIQVTAAARKRYHNRERGDQTGRVTPHTKTSIVKGGICPPARWLYNCATHCHTLAITGHSKKP
jgi:hypothetical protein